MYNQSDYFKPLDLLEIEAIRFCKHKHVRDWYYYDYGNTLTDRLKEIPHGVQLVELDAMQRELEIWSQETMRDLEGYEAFELCKLVKEQKAKLSMQLDELHSAVQKLK